MKNRRTWMLLGALLLVLAACAKPPQAEIDTARAKVGQAGQNPDVVAYAPDTLAKAREALSKMEKELEAKRYDAVKAAALEAAQLADKAPVDALANKERIKAQAEGMLADAGKALEGLKLNAKNALKTGVKGLDKASVEKELAGLEAKLAEAKSILASGDYLKARDAAAQLQAGIADLERRIADAIQKARKKK